MTMQQGKHWEGIGKAVAVAAAAAPAAAFIAAAFALGA